MHRWLSTSFSLIEDILYVGLGFLLAGVAGALLITEVIYFIQYISARALSENVVLLLDRVLLIIIFAEVLYTVQVSLRQARPATGTIPSSGTYRSDPADPCLNGGTAKNGEGKRRPLAQRSS